MARGVTRGASRTRGGKPRAPGREAQASAPAPTKAAPVTASPASKSPAEPAPSPSRQPAPADGFIAVAEIARPHGVQGELRLKVYNPESDLLAQKPRVRLRFRDGSTRDVAITSARDVNKALLVRLSGVDDRDAAEALRGAEVCVPRESFPPLEEGEFYACDVEGARALLPGGEELGHVVAVTSYPTCDVLVIDRASGGRLEVPLLPAYVESVDVAQGVVQILTIDGLD